MNAPLDFDSLLQASPVRAGSGFAHEPCNGTATTVEWYTPGWIFEALGLTYDLDPCSPAGGLPWLPAANHYSLPDDGLTLPWAGRIWCNPPYGPETPRWLQRMNEHRDGVALVFARTDTEWFHDSVTRADAILFLKKRVRFVDRSGQPAMVKDKKTGRMRKGTGAGSGSMLVAWGSECVEALRSMSAHGFLVQPPADDFGDLL